MESDVASDVEVSDADPSDVASDESMEPPEEDVPEELVAVAWLGRSSPIGSRYFLRDYVYIYVYIYLLSPSWGGKENQQANNQRRDSWRWRQRTLGHVERERGT